MDQLIKIANIKRKLTIVLILIILISKSGFNQIDYSEDRLPDFSGIVFDSIVCFARSHFDHPVSFAFSKFNELAQFTCVNFDSTVDFRNSKFEQFADFYKLKSNYSIIFRDAIFNSKANFFKCEFNKVGFEKTKFNSNVQLNSSIFSSETSFQFVDFAAEANFSYSKFKSEVSFIGANFYSSVSFQTTEFNSLVSFSSATFNDDICFYGTTLPHILDFSYCKIKCEIDLTCARINKNYNVCEINLINSDIEKIKFRYKRFKLYLPDTLDIDVKRNIYEQVLKKQNEEGYLQSYEILDKEYKRFVYIESHKYSLFIGYLLDYINLIWWDYGYSKILILRNTLILFLLFSFINSFVLKRMIINVYRIPKFEFYISELNHKLSLYSISQKLFLSMYYTGIIFFGVKIDLKALRFIENSKGWKVLNLIYFFTIYCAGFICLGYLANYILSQ